MGPSITNDIGLSNVPTPVQDSYYYVQEATSLCIDGTDVPPAYPDVETFDDHAECCRSKRSWNEQKCLDSSPTLSPTLSPSWSPSTSFPTETNICPDLYDASKNYRGGDEMQVNLVAYRCKRPPYSSYCNNPEFKPPDDDPGPTEESKVVGNVPIANPNVGGGSSGDEGLWRDAWERLYACTYTPTASPSVSPTTAAPTCQTRWHPGDFRRRICTNSPNYPDLWNDPVLKETYFTDTAEECCEKFYPGKKCRMRNKC